VRRHKFNLAKQPFQGHSAMLAPFSRDALTILATCDRAKTDMPITTVEFGVSVD
jgi:hypothetical protein